MRFDYKVSLEVVSGSRLYGLETEKSDFDFRGFFVPTNPEHLLGFRTKENVETRDPDRTLFDIRKFVKLALSGNTVALECLFAPSKFVTEIDEFGGLLRELKKDFLSKKIYRVIRGYAQAEYRKTLGETTGDLGEKRKGEVTRLGYSPKNASHCIRLLLTGFKLFQTGEYLTSFDKETNSMLMNFKLGKLTVEDFTDGFKVFEGCLDKEFKENFYELPEEPYEDNILEILSKAIQKRFR